MATGLPLSLEEQIRQQWGGYGEWDAAGVDRVAELADLLRANGIEDISQLGYKDSKVDINPGGWGTLGSGDGEYGQAWRDPTTLDKRTYYYGDKELGFLGDANNDGTYSKIGDTSQGDLGAWSARGHGNVGYHWKVGPDGKPYLAPAWASSSDMEDVRNVAMLAGVMALAGGAVYAAGGAGAGLGAAEGGAAASTAGGMTAEQIAAVTMADSVYAGAATGGGGGSFFSSLLGGLGGTGGAGGAMNWMDIAKLAVTGYGLYQNKQATDRAGDQADLMIDLSGEAAKRQAELAERAYNDYSQFLPGLMEDTQFARDRAKTTAQQADELYAQQMAAAKRYDERWQNVQVPLEDQVIAAAKQYGTQEYQDRQAGIALADTRGQYDTMRQAQLRAQQRMGVNPTSGAALALANDAYMSEALGGAGAMTGARRDAADKYFGAMGSAAALGRGLPGFASGATSGATAAGGLSLNAGQAGINATGSAINATGNAYANVGNLWNNALNAGGIGYNAASNYANLINQNPFSTMAGYGASQWMWPSQQKPPGG